MTIDITGSQADHLAALVHRTRLDWDTPGIKAALWKVRDRPLALVAYAAVRAAQTASNKTPAVIALDGPHWRAPTAAELPTPIPPRKCPTCGWFARTPEGACLDCELQTEASDDAPPAHVSQAAARQALRGAS